MWDEKKHTLAAFSADAREEWMRFIVQTNEQKANGPTMGDDKRPRSTSTIRRSTLDEISSFTAESPDKRVVSLITTDSRPDTASMISNKSRSTGRRVLPNSGECFGVHYHDPINYLNFSFLNIARKDGESSDEPSDSSYSADLLPPSPPSPPVNRNAISKVKQKLIR
jgi:plasmid stabilization system protein ParE